MTIHLRDLEYPEEKDLTVCGELGEMTGNPDEVTCAECRTHISIWERRNEK